MPESTENLDASSGVAAFEPIESGTLVSFSGPRDVYLISNGEITMDCDRSTPNESFLVIQDLTNYTKFCCSQGNKTDNNNRPHALRCLRMQDSTVVYMVVYPAGMNVLVSPEPTP